MAATTPPSPPPSKDLASQSDPLMIQRGDYSPSSLPASLIFILGRALTGPVQYYLITHHPLRALFPSLPPVPLGHPPIKLSLPSTAASVLGLSSHYEFHRLPLLCATMPALHSAKTLIWFSFLMQEHMTLPFAVFGVVADIVYESISSLVFTTAGANPLWNERLFYFGLSLNVIGLATELLSELQRYAFKRDPANKGKVCNAGLWGVVRHINYSCNMVYGWAYGLACGGPVYSVLTCGMYVANLGWNATPSKEAYMKEKYGIEWEKYCQDTRWKFFPGLR